MGSGSSSGKQVVVKNNIVIPKLNLKQDDGETNLKVQEKRQQQQQLKFVENSDSRSQTVFNKHVSSGAELNLIKTFNASVYLQ
jgi:hypothetical protein